MSLWTVTVTGFAEHQLQIEAESQVDAEMIALEHCSLPACPAGRPGLQVLKSATNQRAEATTAPPIKKRQTSLFGKGES